MTIETVERRTCDRCGATSGDDAKGWGTVTAYTVDGNVLSQGAKMDLCPDCVGSLYSWSKYAGPAR